MADTQRSRADILALMADNVTGDISAQDLRDFIVTIMEASTFVYAGDFFAQPTVASVSTNRTAKGWKVYSQIMQSDCSFRNILCKQSNGMWERAHVSQSVGNRLIGVAMESYLSNESQAIVLMAGMIYHSAFDSIFSDNLGHMLYLGSGASLGSYGLLPPAGFSKVIGYVEGSTGHWRFIANMGNWTAVSV